MTRAPLPQLTLVYDAECPACSQFSRLLNLRESVGELLFVDAREDSAVLREITAAGFDIDQGMVLKVDEQLYYGADAMHALALMGSRSGVFNRLNYAVFKSASRARFFYPILRFLRSVLLRILRKTKINNLSEEN